MRNWLAPILATMLLAACAARTEAPTSAGPASPIGAGKPSAAQTAIDDTGPIKAVSALHGPQLPPVEFGTRPPNTPMTHDNMPYFDTVAYCERTTRRKEKLVRGPLYEDCIADQQVNHDVIADAIDAGKYKEADVVHCAKASRTAYQGMWYCLNQQPF